MDHLSPNCIAGASSPYKVVSFTVPAQALALSVHLSVRESHCKAKLEGASALNFKSVLKVKVCIVHQFAQGLGLQLMVRGSTKLGESLDVSFPAWPDSDCSGNLSGIKSSQGSKA